MDFRKEYLEHSFFLTTMRTPLLKQFYIIILHIILSRCHSNDNDYNNGARIFVLMTSALAPAPGHVSRQEVPLRSMSAGEFASMC